MAESPSELRVEIEKLEHKHAENPEGRYFVPLANAYRKLGAVEHAESLLRDGLRRHPDYLSAHVVLGRCLADQRATTAAVDEFRYVLSLDPQNLIALRSLAELALVDGRSADAVHWYRELLAVDPMNDDARRALEDLSGPAPAAAGAAHPDPPMRDDWLQPLDESTMDAGYRWDETETVPGDDAFSETADDIGLVHFDGGLERDEERDGERSDFDSAPLELEQLEADAEGGDPHPHQLESFASEDDFSAESLPGLVQSFTEAGDRFDDGEPLNTAGLGDDRHDSAEPPAVGVDDPFAMPGSAGEEGQWAEAEEDPDALHSFRQTPADDADESEEVDDDGPAELATETIAELYARQGFYARAAEVLREVIRRRGGDEALSRRLAEIERLAAGGEAQQETAAAAGFMEVADEVGFDAGDDREDLAGAAGDEDVADSSRSDRQPAAEAESESEADAGAVRFGFLEFEGPDQSAEDLPALPGLNGGYAETAAAAGAAGVGRFQFDDSDVGGEAIAEPAEEDAFADSFTHGFHAPSPSQADSSDGEDGSGEPDSAAGTPGGMEEEPWGGDVYAATSDSRHPGEVAGETTVAGEPEGETISAFLRALVSWKRTGEGGGAGAFDPPAPADHDATASAAEREPQVPAGESIAPTWSPEGEAASARDADDSADIASIWESPEQVPSSSPTPERAAVEDVDAMPEWLDVGPDAPGEEVHSTGDASLPAPDAAFPGGTGSAADEEPFPWEESPSGAPAPDVETSVAEERRERGSELEDYLAFDEVPGRSSGGTEEADPSFEAYLAFDEDPGAATPATPSVEPEPEPVPAPPAATPAPSAPTPAPAAGAAQEDDDDLESFQTWLRSLKR